MQVNWFRHLFVFHTQCLLGELRMDMTYGVAMW